MSGNQEHTDVAIELEIVDAAAVFATKLNLKTIKLTL